MCVCIHIEEMASMEQNHHGSLSQWMFNDVPNGLLGWQHRDGWDDVQAIRKDHVLQAASDGGNLWKTGGIYG